MGLGIDGAPLRGALTSGREMSQMVETLKPRLVAQFEQH
jgi:hypothetical protein